MIAMNTQQPGISTTLRPRNRRLISIDDEFETIESGSPAVFESNHPTTSSSLLSSRAASPIPSKHPSRSASINRTSERGYWDNGSQGSLGSGADRTGPSAFTSGLWGSSWTSIQGIASALLGSDTKGTTRDKSRVSRSPKRRKPSDLTNSRKPVPTLPEQWGPSINVERRIAYGSQEDRLAQFQAKKRETLLTANGHNFPDSTGTYKRRLSEDRECMSAPPPEDHDRDALVYLHHVQPNDTLAGIAIKYNCPIATFRKANRLWPNDRIQIRDVVYLPVEACGVRGRKVGAPGTNLSLLRDNNDMDLAKTPTTSNAASGYELSPDSRLAQQSSTVTSPSISASNTNSPDPPWKHDSWVVIDPSHIAVEIARLPRRTLGFFPPSRRKSVTFSDLETPSRSLELSRNQDLGTSPAQRTSPRRHGSPYPNNKSRSSSGSNWVSALSGVGGVGTLGHDVRSPGPAQDKLNQLFAPHLPNVAPRTSFESVASTSSTGIENVGGAIEGWMRKMATRAAAAVQTPPLGGKSGAGDLIELMEGWELDGGSGDTDTITEERQGCRRIDEREDEERMLTERFPVRGRVFEDKGRKKGV